MEKLTYIILVCLIIYSGWVIIYIILCITSLCKIDKFIERCTSVDKNPPITYNTLNDNKLKLVNTLV